MSTTYIPMQADRHLAEVEKLGILELWFQDLTSLPWQEAAAAGGRGQPDTDMASWCFRLNAIPGVCTIQSCAGHRSGDLFHSGHLWIRLNDLVSQVFDAHALELASNCPPIEQVARLYMSDGQEVAAITFQGNERGSLVVSMGLICSFFEKITAGR